MMYYMCAVQLSDFLEPHLQKGGGIMTLADVYCLFNRARGTELISPDDLLQAASLFTKWSAPMYLRQFSSGVTVIQSNLHSDDEVISFLYSHPTREFLAFVAHR